MGTHRQFLRDAWNFLDSRRDWLEACEHLVAAVAKHEGNAGGGHARAEKYLGPCYRGDNHNARQQETTVHQGGGVGVPREKLISQYVKMMGYVQVIRERHRKGLLQ